MPVCSEPGCPNLVDKPGRCPGCRPKDDRPSAARRGYGRVHQELRKTWARKVAAGGVLCARCGKLIEPGQPWDLGHVDGDKTRYAGPEHESCNRATKTHQAARP